MISPLEVHKYTPKTYAGIFPQELKIYVSYYMPNYI